MIHTVWKWITLAITNRCRTVGITGHQALNSCNTIFNIIATGITITLTYCQWTLTCLNGFLSHSKQNVAAQPDQRTLRVTDGGNSETIILMHSCGHWGGCIDSGRGRNKIKKEETFYFIENDCDSRQRQITRFWLKKSNFQWNFPIKIKKSNHINCETFW